MAPPITTSAPASTNPMRQRLVLLGTVDGAGVTSESPTTDRSTVLSCDSFDDDASSLRRSSSSACALGYLSDGSFARQRATIPSNAAGTSGLIEDGAAGVSHWSDRMSCGRFFPVKGRRDVSVS